MAAKRILVLNGSPRKEKSTTMALTKAFVKGMTAKGECEAEFINISDLNVRPCTGCLSCWGKTEGQCVIKNDDIDAIKAKVNAADFVIMSYPLYFFGMPGSVKVFTDRMLSMLCTYRGQSAPENGRSFHGIRNPEENRRFLIITSCAYSEAEPVYEPLLKQYDCICGKENYTAICCPQIQTLVDMGESPRLTRYLAKFEKAGAAFAESGALSPEAVKNLSKPPFSEDTYKILLDDFWQRQKKGAELK